MSDNQDDYDEELAIADTIGEIDEGSDASFFAAGNIGEINPGIIVENVGSIGLPVSEHEAQRLIAASHQASYGKGSDTFVDTSVRKTWEIDGARIEFSHPNWAHHMQNVVHQVAETLGVASGAQSVRAELYKILVYEPGAMFKAHTE